MACHRTSALTALSVLVSFGAGAAEGPSLCATPAQAIQVREAFAARPQPTTFMAAARLRLPEAVVASALPDGRGVGVSGNEFSKVWDSLGTWGDALTLVDKGGSIFEIRGRIPAGKPSEKSRYFNLNGDGLPLAGHLRPDLLGAIYAVELAGADAPVQGVIFLDQQGQGVFGVYVPAEGGKPAPETMADFRRTRDLMSRLAPLCPPASG